MPSDPVRVTARPAWQVVLERDTDHRDITAQLAVRLVSLEVTQTDDDTADQLDIALTDTDALLDIPPTGAVLAVSVGFDGQVASLGRYTVDELEMSNPPRRLHITGRAAEVGAAWKEPHERSFEVTTFGALVTGFAMAHGQKVHVSEQVAHIVVQHADQTNESDINFLTRVGQEAGATVTIKGGVVLAVPQGSHESVSGKQLPGVRIAETMASRWRWLITERNRYGGVKARWRTPGQAKDAHVTRSKAKLNRAIDAPGKSDELVIAADTGGAIYVLHDVYPDETSAIRAATAKFLELQRQRAGIEVALGMAQIACQPGAPVELAGFHPRIDQVQWHIAQITHHLGEGGYKQDLRLESDDQKKDGKGASGAQG